MNNRTRIYTIEAIRAASKSRPHGYERDVLESGTSLFDEAGALRAVMLDEDGHKSLVKKYENQPKTEGGPGTELKGLLAMIGIRSSPTCGCNAKAREMDEMGPELCRQKTAEIVGWLQEEAGRRKLPFSRFAARKLVQTAIARAERKKPKNAAPRA